MKKLLLLFFAINASAQAPAVDWAKLYGGTSNDVAKCVRQTNDGGYIVAGLVTSSDGDVTGNSGSADYWVAKLDNAGLMQWQKTYGGTGYDDATAIEQTSDGGYIIAGSSSSNDVNVTGGHGSDDYWIVKINSVGLIEWQKTFGGSNYDNPFAVRQTSEGGYVIAGRSKSTNGDITNNHGGEDFWVLKINNFGLLEWQKALGGQYDDAAFDIKQVSDGGYIIVGDSYSTNGNVTENLGQQDGWIVKLNANGLILWQKSIGGSLYDSAREIVQTNDGGYVVAGFSSSNFLGADANRGANDAWLCRLDGNGTILWQQSYGGIGGDYGYAIRQTADNAFVLAGNTQSTDGDMIDNHGGYDAWILKINYSGILQWQKQLGGSDNEWATSIILTYDQRIVACGYSGSSSVDAEQNHGLSDFFIFKLLSDNLAVANYNKGFMKAYPNPTTNVLYLQIPNEFGIDKITITDLSGKTILQQTKNAHQINVQNLASGIYFLQAISNNQTYQTKFLKQ